MLSAFTCYANYPFMVDNEGEVSKKFDFLSEKHLIFYEGH